MSPKRVNQCLVVIALLIVAVYLSFRALYTFSFDSMWFAVLFYAAELHGAFVFFLFCFETWDPQHPEPIDPPPGMTVDIYVCTYNEDPALLRKTILGTEAIDYPHTTYICDDGHREEVRRLAEELGVEYLDRPDNSHAKAGNINHALPQTRGDFIAILDADHVPLPDFLHRMLGYFTDPEVAFVQSPQTFYNLDAPEERVDLDSGTHWDEAEIFFHLILPGKNRWNSVYFCGTGGIIRRTALEQIGGFATDTITEDIHTALKMHQRGWKSVYIAEHLASGQAAGDLPSYHVQRTRWALGNLRVMFCCNPLFAPGLSWAQRLSYLSSMFHWTIGLRKLILYAAPLVVLLLNVYPISKFGSFVVVLYLLQLVVQLAAFKFITRGRGRIITDEVFAMLNFWVFSSSFVRACLKLSTQKFEVTDKSAGQQFSMTSIKPHFVFLAISAVALVWGGLRLYYDVNSEPFGIVIAAFWCLWNAAIAIKVILLATEAQTEHEDIRFFDHIPILYRCDETSDHPERLAITMFYGEAGMTIIAYEPLETGQQVDTTLVLRFFRVQVRMEVLRAQPNLRKNDRTYVYDVRFIDIDNVGRDMLNTHTMLYTTPRLLDYLGQRGRKRMYDQSWGWLTRRRRTPMRIDFPISLDPEHNNWVHARVEQIDLHEGQMHVETPVDTDTTWPFLMATPLGPVRGTLRALSNEPPTFHASPIYHCRVQFESFDNGSEVIVKELAGV